MITVPTPSAPYPQARIAKFNPSEGFISFAWLDADGNPVDSGNSLAPFTAGEDWPTEADIGAAIEASTAVVAPEAPAEPVV